MNPNSLLFSHQYFIAHRLSRDFEKVTVFTAETNPIKNEGKIEVRSIRWKPGDGFIGALRLLSMAIPFLVKNRKDLVVFSHMTDLYSFLIAPISKLLGIPHYLWYAHRKMSPYLFMSKPFLNGVITSTEDSCPIKGKKVTVVGQGVEYRPVDKQYLSPRIPPLRWYTVSRLDPSKNIDLLIDTLNQFKTMYPELTFDIYGSPSSQKFYWYYRKLESKKEREGLDWVNFCGPLKNHSVPYIANEHDAFIHAFEGSLDKALVEAVLSKRIVVSINSEFNKLFGFPVFNIDASKGDLVHQISKLYATSSLDIVSIVNKRFDVALMNHTSLSLTPKLVNILK